MIRNYRKPLVIVGPKVLLRHPSAVSTMDDMLPGTMFRPVLPDRAVKDGQKVERVVFVTGKHFYTVDKERSARAINDMAVVRLEVILMPPPPLGGAGGVIFLCRPSVFACPSVCGVVSAISALMDFHQIFFSSASWNSEALFTLRFGVKRSKVRVIGRRHTQLDTVRGVLTFSALEVFLKRYALYKSTFYLLTLLTY